MNRLKELRTQAGLSLRKLASYVDIDFSRLAVIEKTDANLEGKTVERLTSFFGVDYAYLMGEDGFMSFYNDEKGVEERLIYSQFRSVIETHGSEASVVDGKLRRVLPKKGWEEVDRYFDVEAKAIDLAIAANRVCDLMDSLSDDEYLKYSGILKDYMSVRDPKVKGGF